MNIPKISVVTPNYNGMATIETTIKSILDQDYPYLEYIIMDDGSTDQSMQVISKYKNRLAHVEKHENCGQYATINRGFSRATGDIYAWLNSDDIYFPWTLRAVAQIFTAFPKIDWIMGLPSKLQEGIIHKVNPVRSYPQELISSGLFFGPERGVIQQESCFWRKKLWDKVGGLDERWKRAGDFELWTRFAENAPLVCVASVLGGFSVTGDNRSIVGLDAYNFEVEKIIENLNFKKQKQREDSLKKIKDLKENKNTTKLFSGLVIRRDFEKKKYNIENEVFLIR